MTKDKMLREEWLKFYAWISAAPFPLREKAIWDFWQAKISERDEEVVRELEGRKLELKDEDREQWPEKYEGDIGYNSGLQSAIEVVKKL